MTRAPGRGQREVALKQLSFALYERFDGGNLSVKWLRAHRRRSAMNDKTLESAIPANLESRFRRRTRVGEVAPRHDTLFSERRTLDNLKKEISNARRVQKYLNINMRTQRETYMNVSVSKERSPLCIIADFTDIIVIDEYIPFSMLSTRILYHHHLRFL